MSMWAPQRLVLRVMNGVVPPLGIGWSGFRSCRGRLQGGAAAGRVGAGGLGRVGRWMSGVAGAVGQSADAASRYLSLHGSSPGAAAVGGLSRFSAPCKGGGADARRLDLHLRPSGLVLVLSSAEQ